MAYIAGDSDNNEIDGTSEVDVINGYGGDDIINGGSGKDEIYGSEGSDYFIDNNLTRDLFWGGSGIDTIDFSGTDYGIAVDLLKNNTDRGDYIYSVENVIGTDYDDSFTGDWGDNVFDGGLGKDQMRGGGGNDYFIDTDGGRDIIWGGWLGNDTVDFHGSDSAISVSLGDTVYDDWRTAELGSSSFGDHISGLENVVGTAYDDTLVGNYKDNVITGMEGRDILAGGDGADTFAYMSVDDSSSDGSDLILDFETGSDVILLDFDVSIADVAIEAYPFLFNEITIDGTDFSILVQNDISLSDIVIAA